MNDTLSDGTFITYRPMYSNLNSSAPNDNYVDYRCIEPSATETNSPWFRIPNTCPCDPKLSNPSGRGFLGCPFGIQTDTTVKNSVSGLTKIIPKDKIDKVNYGLYPEISGYSMSSVPQFQPRPLSQIGYTWRSAN